MAIAGMVFYMEHLEVLCHVYCCLILYLWTCCFCLLYRLFLVYFIYCVLVNKQLLNKQHLEY